MALEHALLVSLSEREASGLDLTRRFDRSIGFFWSATHQQIYRVLARMEADGWVSSEVVAQSGRPDKKGFDYSFGFLDHRHAHRQYTDHLFRNAERVATDLQAFLRQDHKS